MTRIVSYNILAGGYNIREAGVRRSAQIIAMLRSVQPDVVGLVEAIHPKVKQTPSVLEEIAKELQMQAVLGSTHCREYPLALLTRLPIVGTKIHERPGIFARPLLEVCVEEENGEHLTIYLTHLSASFNRGRAGGAVRLREVAEILRITAPLRAEGKPHLIMGDCNSLAPGDAFKASSLLRYVAQMDPASLLQYPLTDRRNEENLTPLPKPSNMDDSNETMPNMSSGFALGPTHDGHPNFNSVVPPQLRFLQPLLNLVVSSDMLCSLFDMAAYLYAPRGCIRNLKHLYVDCYRHIHPYKQGFTCPATAPAGRIDYIFASPSLVERLTDCEVLLTGAGGITGDQASDHLAITAEFGLRVASSAIDTILDMVDSADNVMAD